MLLSMSAEAVYVVPSDVTAFKVEPSATKPILLFVGDVVSHSIFAVENQKPSQVEAGKVIAIVAAKFFPEFHVAGQFPPEF